jgi:ribosome-binding factor A
MNTNDRFTRNDAGKRNVRKTLQLCRQAQVALSQALSSIDEEAFLDVSIESVQPAPDASHLMVFLVLPKNARATVKEVREALQRRGPRLHAEVAASITRKRAPELSFMFRAGWEVIP